MINEFLSVLKKVHLRRWCDELIFVTPLEQVKIGYLKSAEGNDDIPPKSCIDPIPFPKLGIQQAVNTNLNPFRLVRFVHTEYLGSLFVCDRVCAGSPLPPDNLSYLAEENPGR